MLMSIVLAIVKWKVWRASLSHSFRLQTEQGSGKFVSTICETFNSLVGLKTIYYSPISNTYNVHQRNNSFLNESFTLEYSANLGHLCVGARGTTCTIIKDIS